MTGWKDHFFHENKLFNLSSSEDWLLDNIDKDVQLNAHLALAISQSNVIVVCDGSYYKEHAAGGAGWYIETLDQARITSGDCISPGPAKAQSSARSELVGILASIMHINYICERFDIQQGNVALYCDNERSVKALNANHGIIKNSRKNFDMFQSIHMAIQHSTVQWSFHHIRGHQDDELDFNQLSRPQQLNVLADLKAKEAVLRGVESGIISTYRRRSLPYSTCDIMVADNKGNMEQVTTHLQKSIQNHCSTLKLRKYWLNKHQLIQWESKIDWELKRHSHKNSTKSRNRWLCKHSTGFCGVEKMLLRYKYQAHSTCPRCGASQESTSHVLQCNDDSACQLWDNEVDTLNKWMIEKKGQPNLAKVIVDNLHSWKYRLPKSNALPHCHTLRKAIIHQDRIGWKQFIEGFWDSNWRECQQQHFDNIQSPSSSLLLLSKVQRRIWKIAWLMWEHRNHHLHETSHSIPAIEQTAIDEEIRNEWNIGISALTERHRHLFNGSLEEKSQKKYHTKRIWLSTVWSARETVDRNHLANNQVHTDTTTRLRFEQWKRKQNITG